MNFIDTPGLFDFEGGLWEGVRAADTVMIAVSGKNGVSVGTEKAVKAAESRGLSKVFFVNGLCDESARFYRVFETLKASFGPSVCPVVVPFIVDGQANCYVNLLEYKAYAYSPDGKVSEVPMPDMGDRLEGLRTAIYEAVAETSDEMFEKYFSGEQFDRDEIIRGIAAYQPVGSRARVVRTARYTVIDDCYNANPDSTAAALRSMATLPAGRRVAVLGNMGELGAPAAALHRETGVCAAKAGVSLVITCGELARQIAAGAAAEDPAVATASFDTLDALLPALPGLLQPGDCVLVKASHSMQFERIVQALTQA